ncbi:hypothetical protein OPT61_g6441 [Boeremia exigua]|uniref:Uncharacterized protein n=1 Tax=Boeremia exigua TaxID=749465 RepID=A0ACC2I6R1_9PLEO|nr:hypothetical protein OPT61_g6441 [Boeremia exigua]
MSEPLIATHLNSELLYNMDYSKFGIASQEWLTFIEANPSAAQDGFTKNNPAHAAELRKSSNKARGEAGAQSITATGLDDCVSISTVQIPCKASHSVPLRIYKPKHPRGNHLEGAVLYFHGGGYLFGDETSDDFLCCRIADETNACVLSVIYRHTHKYKHPAQVDDAWEAFEYVRDNADTLDPSICKALVVMGISAGCTLAASVILRDLELSKMQSNYTRRIRGALLGIPWLIHIDNYPSHLFKSRKVAANIQNEGAPVVPSERLKMFSYLLGADNPADRLLNIPLLSEKELEEWPKTAFMVAGADPLRDDGLLFAKKLEHVGVHTRTDIYPGLPHGFRRWPQLAAAQAFDATVIECALWAFEKNNKEKYNRNRWNIYSTQTPNS